MSLFGVSEPALHGSHPVTKRAQMRIGEGGEEKEREREGGEGGERGRGGNSPEHQ